MPLFRLRKPFYLYFGVQGAARSGIRCARWVIETSFLVLQVIGPLRLGLLCRGKRKYDICNAFSIRQTVARVKYCSVYQNLFPFVC